MWANFKVRALEVKHLFAMEKEESLDIYSLCWLQFMGCDR